ncbi:MAG: FAD-binding oxidoreductase [Gaiellaceae bacterium MAG52_C11]|nr:FAD-binding oxidoreductase [Candidatus Gaiellasilicea maunaloa]
MRRCDSLVVGGGLTGCAAAYYLAKAGLDVLLVERNDLNTEASGRNAGGFHVQIQLEPFLLEGEEWARNWVRAIPLLIDAVRHWETLSGELGADLEVRLTGGLLAAETTEQLAALERKAAIERAAGLEVELLSRRDLRRIAPYLSSALAGGLLCPLEGKASPLLAAPAFARAARSQGARIALHTELLAIERTAAGFRVETSGSPIECERVLDCAGTAVGDIAALVGVELPIESLPLQVHVTEPIAPLVRHLVAFAGEPLTVKQSAHGSVLIGGGWPSELDDAGRADVSLSSLRGNLRVAAHVIPALANVRLLRIWTGFCNGTPDHRPILGELDEVPGFFVASFPYLGFTAAPLLGKLVGDLSRGLAVPYDLAPFAAGRFSTTAV